MSRIDPSELMYRILSDSCPVDTDSDGFHTFHVRLYDDLMYTIIAKPMHIMRDELSGEYIYSTYDIVSWMVEGD